MNYIKFFSYSGFLKIYVNVFKGREDNNAMYTLPELEEAVYRDNLFEILYLTPLLKLSNGNAKKIKTIRGEPLDLSKKSELNAIVDKEWDARMIKAKAQYEKELSAAKTDEDREKVKMKLGNGTQFRMSGFYVDERDDLTLKIAESGYKNLVGTEGLCFGSSAFPETADTLHKNLIMRGIAEGYAYKNLSQTLAICVAIESADGKYVIMKRAKGLGEYGEARHTVGGHPDPSHFKASNSTPKDKILTYNKNEFGLKEDLQVSLDEIDFDKAISAEIKDEVGMVREDYRLSFTALIRNRQSGKPELVFSAKVKKYTAKEMLKLPRKEKWEALRTKEGEDFRGYSRNELETLIKTEPYWCPPGKAACLIHLYMQELYAEYQKKQKPT